MRPIENISQELFDKIRSRVSSIRLGDETGAVTTDPKQARFFEFNFKHRNLPVGAVTISLNEEGVLQVYFPNSMVEDVDTNTANAWYGFLKELSKFSARNMLNYETHNVTKERLDKKDYQFLTQRSQDEVMENKMYGTSQKSFLEQGTAKLIIQHDKTVDETKMGARSRNIKAIYIENADGERFKFANNYLPGARAMARHISNEGHTRDERGGHIVSIMHEMNDLKTFVRAIKREDYVTDEQNEIIEAATDRYYGLKDTLKSLASANGYQSYFENWVPEAVEDEGDLDDLKEKLTRTVYDERLTTALPAVRRAMEQRSQMREANDEEALKMAMSDEPIEIFDNEADMAEIKNYMQYIKNSDMEAQRKNQALVVAIVRFLVKNSTNDNLANAMSEFDVENKKHMAAGYALAKKFIQGKYEVKQKAAKKDLYGKEKSESVTFESFEQSMDMIAEGTWALPENEAEAMKIAAMMANPIALGDGGDDAINALGGLLGDDELFDDLGEAGDKDPEGDARGIIIGWMMEHTDWNNPKYSEAIKMALDKIRADGNDSDITIPRTFGNTSSTQGERMGSNADDVKANEDESVQEGRMSDLHQDIEEMINDGASDEEIMKAHPEASKSDIASVRKDMKEDVTESMCSLKCKHCGDMLGQPTTDCPCDSMDPKGDHWEMVDIDGDGDDDIAFAKEEIEEVDEATESLAKLKAMAGVGSKFRSNHGIHEGEEGYQLTPRSIVARELRKLQDIEKDS